MIRFTTFSSIQKNSEALTVFSDGFFRDKVGNIYIYIYIYSETQTEIEHASIELHVARHPPGLGYYMVEGRLSSYMI